MSEPTCGMAADAHRSCGTTWLRDPAPILTMPDSRPRVPDRHRCGLVGDHSTHLCPCGSMLITNARSVS